MVHQTVHKNSPCTVRRDAKKIIDRLFCRVRIVYRGLGRAFVVHKNRDLDGNNFLAALGLVCIVTSSQHEVAVFL
jgi:hypothetical protein